MAGTKKALKPLKIFWYIVKSPVSLGLALLAAYFALKVYAFGGDFFDKALMFGAMALWLLWFVIRRLITLLLFVILAAGAVYWYYTAG